ncbi:MAG: GTP cyclohydrolase II, partial [Blastomonas sp.]|nr:GTP cyclohydrolase II [Blastomonas sp.]
MNARAAARALDALARGWDIIVESEDGRLALRPVETGGAPLGTGRKLLISAARATAPKRASPTMAARPQRPVPRPRPRAR